MFLLFTGIDTTEECNLFHSVGIRVKVFDIVNLAATHPLLAFMNKCFL